MIIRKPICISASVFMLASGLAGTAMAQDAAPASPPVSVKMGGYVDFRAGLFHESNNNSTPDDKRGNRNNFDAETEYLFDLTASGESSGVTYGANVSIWNGGTFWNGGSGGNTIRIYRAYTFVEGKWGNVKLGDEESVSSWLTMAPTIGGGQINGSYTDFIDAGTLFGIYGYYYDSLNTPTGISYATPKLGTDKQNVQLGISYIPNDYDSGQSVIKYDIEGVASGRDSAGYKDTMKGAARYNGTFGKLETLASAVVSGGKGESKSKSKPEDYTLWGIGAQAKYTGLTVGGSYVDAGDLNKTAGLKQTRDQSAWTVGAKYEWEKTAVAISYLDGKGYAAFTAAGNGLSKDNNYVKSYKVVGLGATYNWFPGLTSAADLVFFDQKRADTIDDKKTGKNIGHVFFISQKITF